MRKRKRELKPRWTPRILTGSEIGGCEWAIQMVELLGKPITDVSTRYLKNPNDLKADLAGCLKSHKGSGVKYWIRSHKSRGPAHYSYGFYKEPWSLAALDFCHRSKLSDYNRWWIQGLLFGYRA